MTSFDPVKKRVDAANWSWRDYCENSPGDSSKSGKFADLEGKTVEVTVDRISGSGNAIAQYRGYNVYVEDGELGKSYFVELDACIGYFTGETEIKE